MKNKIKLKKASNKAHQPFLTHSTSQPIDSQEVYQGAFESEVADSGRSMVEMLGVLAVVGVLSVGGILGYRSAMDKYHANNILNDLNIIYHSLQTQSLNEVDENGSSAQDLGITPATSYPFRIYIEGEELTSIQVSDLPYRICKQVALTEPPFALFTEINDDNRIGCQERDDNHILYLFSQQGNDVVEGENCSLNVGSDSYDDSASCPTNQVCYHDKCTPCQRDEAELKNHQCVSCAEKENASFGTTDSLNCHKCPQRFLGTNSHCYPCSEEATITVATESECQACGRIYDKSSKKCYRDCESLGSAVVNAQVNCPDRFIGADNKSYPCSHNVLVNVANAADCAKCNGQRTTLSNNSTACVPECGPNHFVTNGYACLPCDYIGTPWSFWITTTTTGNNYACRAACPNRAHHWANQCSLCASGNFLGAGKKTADDYDTCFSCDIEDDVYTTHVGDSFCTTACPNRVMSGNFCIKKCSRAEADSNGGTCPSLP